MNYIYNPDWEERLNIIIFEMLTRRHFKVINRKNFAWT